MTLHFREMTTADLTSVFDVRVSTRENAITMERLERDYGVTPERLAEAMGESVRGWLCEDDGRVVGFAMGNAANGEVTVVAVHPRAEGRGVGRGVLDRVGAWLFASGHEEIWLLTTPDPALRAWGFYASLGWKPTGRKVREDEVLVLRRDEVSP